MHVIPQEIFAQEEISMEAALEVMKSEGETEASGAIQQKIIDRVGELPHDCTSLQHWARSVPSFSLRD